MKRYLTIVICCTLLAGYGCKKKSQSSTSRIKSGTYVWMGTRYEYNQPLCPDVFIEFAVTVVDDTAISVGGDTLPFLRTNATTNQLVFGYDHGYGFHPNEKMLYYDPAKGTMKYSYSFYGSAGQGTSMSVSTEGYHRSVNLQPFVSHIEGVKNMSGTKSEKVWIPSQEQDTIYNFAQSITFKSLTDSTILVSGQVLSLSDSVLYYKSIDPTNHLVVWQTHHTYTAMSTLTFNYSTNQMTFEQLDHGQWSKQVVKLQ